MIILRNIYVLALFCLISSETFIYTAEKIQILMDEAKYLNPFLENLLFSISNDFNSNKKFVKSLMGPLKTRERILSKMLDEKGLDLLEIHDLSRGMLIFLDLEDMYYAIEKFMHISFINVTKINDKFKEDGYYKDINMNFYFQNSTNLFSDQNTSFHLILEVQFQLCHLYHAKLIDDPIYHVRRLTKQDNTNFYPNTFQKEVDYLLRNSFYQQNLFSETYILFKNSYFSMLVCNQFGELYCDIYWEYLMSNLTSISKAVYLKSWDNYRRKVTCDMESFLPENMDLFHYIK